ncbi:MAG: preprotein translocase subunit SecE [Clostridia bacterium]|nr:preprotein translocase subunit SecE [Clostridia bacterium]
MSETKKANIFVRIGRAIVRYFKDLKGECKKITWPTFPSVVKNTLVVIAVCLIVGIGIWVVDWVLSTILGLAGNIAG